MSVPSRPADRASGVRRVLGAERATEEEREARACRIPRSMRTGSAIVLAAIMGTGLVTSGLEGPAAAAGREAAARDAAERVAQAFRSAGAEVQWVPTRFLNDDESASIALPPGPALPCTTVALVGPRGMSFRVRFPTDDNDDEALTSVPSVAGAVELRRCEGATPPRVIVVNEAGRGAVEVVVARSRGPLPPLVSLLPERAGAPPPSHQDPGELPVVGTPMRRAELADQRTRRENGRVLARAKAPAGVDGTGALAVELEPGCHRIELFANEGPSPSRRRSRRLDVDGELRDDDDKLLARDRTEAPDVRLETCVGETTPSYVHFAGSPPETEVQLAHGYWPIPERVPRVWGSEARARMASALFARSARLPEDEPVALLQGASGSTTVSIAVEPGACYLAVAGLTYGSARGLGLRALVGGQEIADERGIAGSAATIAFCTEIETRTRLTVDARGSALAWGAAVYRVQSAPWRGGP